MLSCCHEGGGGGGGGGGGEGACRLILLSLFSQSPLVMLSCCHACCAGQAKKMEDRGQVDFDEEIKRHFKMVYVPNWFSVDLKTGVRHSFCVCEYSCVRDTHFVLTFQGFLTKMVYLLYIMLEIHHSGREPSVCVDVYISVVLCLLKLR